jgi:hypothetical protein
MLRGHNPEIVNPLANKQAAAHGPITVATARPAPGISNLSSIKNSLGGVGLLFPGQSCNHEQAWG